MDLMAYWRWDNYISDLDEGASFNYNSNQSRLHSQIDIGERLWLITGKPTQIGISYLLVAKLTIVAKTYNPPEYKYGRYRLWGDVKNSAYYSTDEANISNLLLNMRFSTESPIKSKDKIGQSLQTIRTLTPNDSALLLSWSQGLELEKRAYKIANEILLENSYEDGEKAVRETIRQYHSGVSENKKLRLIHTYTRNRILIKQLQDFYQGRCQLCGFDPILLYDVKACYGHHVIYLSRGGIDELNNLILVCPNHHEVIHNTNAVFDFKDLCYVFANKRREPLILNNHLNIAG
jgi:predicted restriction endonuclease